MITMRISRAAELLGCEPPATDAGFHGVTTDSRKVEPGMLFAALAGETSDGHDFAGQALDSGAAAVLVSRPVANSGQAPQLVVENVLKSLGTLAAAWRAELGPYVIGITGSNGKTTTREMIANVLAQGADVLATAGNFNNELGLPLTLFGLEPSHRYCVLEMGATKKGDIAYLSRIAAPQLGLVTNIGPAHLKGFGDEEGVARAKGELYQALPADGVAVINADESWSELWRHMCRAERVLTFGHDERCDVFPRKRGRGVTVRTPAGEFALELPLPGEHNVMNALAATTAAVALEIPLQQIRSGLENTRPVPGRLNVYETDAGWTVVDDTYNANPASLYAALQVLETLGDNRWLVLGDMKELGRDSRKMHSEMGEAARALGVQRIYAVGAATVHTVDAFGPGARHFASHESLLDALCAEIRPGVVCLVKGSRSMAMERVVQAISGSRDLRETG
jgi:UDP-N-acetylmuramoyl-tripeptide--D-alanyl-D-alanine ligase